jgi:translocation protein SEC63
MHACTHIHTQNPDPSAAEYFASFVSKAYAALTDEVSRNNYEKFGHPDGPQVRA